MTVPVPPSASGQKAAVRAFVALAVFGVLAALLFWLDPERLYLWLKAVHVMAIIAWMAGMLYLPRLFVYHCQAAPGSPQSETFKVMERRLMRIIMNPAMIVAWVIGLWLAWDGFGFSGSWLHVKLAAVVALSAVHGTLAKGVREFAEDRNTRSERFWRVMNEVPALLMIVIVIMVIVKPF